MCLIALAHRAHPRWPLLLAANRDEFHARPTAALAEWADAPGVLAGRDLTAGGGWLGVNGAGRLAAVTNVRRPEPPQRSRSRGALVADFLSSPTTIEAMTAGLHRDGAHYGLFNLLLVADGEARYASNQPDVATQLLAPGLYGLSNAALDTPWPKTVALKQALQQWLDENAAKTGLDHASAWAPLFAALASEYVAADAALPDTGVGLGRERLLAPAFIRGPLYGTRCSTVVAVNAAGEGTIRERRFGPDGVALGETALHFQWPVSA